MRKGMIRIELKTKQVVRRKLKDRNLKFRDKFQPFPQTVARATRQGVFYFHYLRRIKKLMNKYYISNWSIPFYFESYYFLFIIIILLC